MPFMALREREPYVKAVLDNGDGEVLLEGENLTPKQIHDAIRARFPDDAQFRYERQMVACYTASGIGVRPWRFANEVPRVVDGKIYL
jgi:hypothetical protein